MATKSSKQSSKAARASRVSLKTKPLAVALKDGRIRVPEVEAGLFERADISRRLTLVDVAKLLKAAKVKPMGGEGPSTEVYVELSAAVPWVEGRGWIEAGDRLNSWFPTTTVGFYPDRPNQQQGYLSVWLDGLTVGDAYIAEIRVGGFSVNPQHPGTYNISASDADHVSIIQNGANQTLSVLMLSVADNRALITVETEGLGGWTFHDVLVSHLGPLN